MGRTKGTEEGEWAPRNQLQENLWPAFGLLAQRGRIGPLESGDGCSHWKGPLTLAVGGRESNTPLEPLLSREESVKWIPGPLSSSPFQSPAAAPPHQPNLKEGRGQRSLTVHLLKVSSWSKQRSSKDWKLKWGGEIENNLSTGLSLVRRCGLSGGKGRRICNVHRISKLFSLKDCSNSHPVHSCTWMLLPHSLSSHLLSNG